MMWFLTSQHDNRVISISPLNGKLTIGRSLDRAICDFSVPDDASISRKHATLSIQGEDLVVTDLGSKYGTFINPPMEQKTGGIVKDVTTILHEDDVVRFGAINSVWKVNKIDHVVCASTLKGENLQLLQTCIAKLGGTFKNEWDETVSYLTMPAITLTIKVVLALVQGAHIVSLEFWNKCIEAVKNYSKLPDPREHLPQVVESTLNKEFVSFSPNFQRRRIFSGKQFVFLSRRQLEMYKNVLVMGSATAVLLSESKMTKSMLAESNVIVIQYILNNTTQESQALQGQINSIVNYLKSKGKRVVADAEIGLAVLYCNLEKYCNPYFNYSTEVMKEVSDPQNVKKPPNVLAPESQESSHNVGVKKDVLVEESFMTQDENFMNINNDTTNSFKRKLSDEFAETENTSKKIATEKNVTIDDNSPLFNFLEEEASGNLNKDKNSLSFLKPMKRKLDENIEMDDDEDNLFNFITMKDKSQESTDKTKSNLFENKIKEEPITPRIKRQKIDDDKKNISINFSELFGKSIKNLLQMNTIWKSTNDIKKEDITDELEDKISELDLGTTTVIINNNLIVENKVPINIELQDSKVRNFKKFKKVWPIKMQVTIIPKESMSIVKPDASLMGDIQVSDSDDDISIKPTTSHQKQATKINDFFTKK